MEINEYVTETQTQSTTQVKTMIYGHGQGRSRTESGLKTFMMSIKGFEFVLGLYFES